MSESVMLRADLAKVTANLTNRSEYSIRACDKSDLNALGKLYFQSYEPGDACDSETGAIKDIKSSFEGEYGPFWFKASKILEKKGKVVGAILVVHKNSWDETVTCPYIIELFVDKVYRRQSLANDLIISACNELRNSDSNEVALTVRKNNLAAKNLYSKLGFQELQI